MNYKLAKQLKDAGFPCLYSSYKYYCSVCKKCFSDTGGSYCDCDYMKLTDEQVNDKDVYIPTLSELIDACYIDSRYRKFVLTDEGIDTDMGYENLWAVRIEKGHDEFWNNGDTKKEAVANLWLELTKEINK